MEHLIRVHQRRRIVLLQGLPNNEDARWRELGYLEALAQHHIPFDPALVVPGDFDRQVACLRWGAVKKVLVLRRF
ncbi:MAG: hypothetical protein IPL78_21630 [Chloroflexi bacterium]|nr:hypothetical protein [Chloroflexota bacterium]